MMTQRLFPSSLVSLALALGFFSGSAPAAPPPKPVPAFANVSYGPYPQNVLDVFQPPATGKPTPAILWYGGIWKADKGDGVVGEHFYPHGIALVCVETRAMHETIAQKLNPPISGVLLDARRALQFVRLHAADYNIDPDKIAVAGGSQGTLVALYVSCSGEKADPNATDPVERVSTKVVCTGAWRSQPSIDPKRMQEWVPGVEWGAPALGMSFKDSLAKRDELLPEIKQWSPDYLINPQTAPIYFEYDFSPTVRPPNVPEMPYKVHSPLWAIGFQKVAEAQGVPCYVRYPGHESTKYKDMWDFLVEMLTGKPS